MNSRDIIQLLKNRHREDVFVPECKNGSTHFGHHIRLDAWAMRKSWANAATFGYEIKVSRKDFLSDDKWTGYLDYCDMFYFVCPHGMIQPEELSESAGLLWVFKQGSGLRLKKKAPHRSVVIPEDFYRYLLMCRV